MSGGYQTIDLSKDPFISGTPNTVHGTFKKALSDKVIMVGGIRLGASSLTVSTMTDDDLAKLPSEWVTFSGDSDSVSATLSDNTTVEITKTDAVTITAGA